MATQVIFPPSLGRSNVKRLLLCFVLWLVLGAEWVSAQPTNTAPLAQYEPHVSARAIAYQRIVSAESLTAAAWSLLGLWLFWKLGCSLRLRNRVQRNRISESASQPNPPPLRQLLPFGFGLLLTLALWNLPFHVLGLLIEKHFGFSNQSLGGFIRDQLLNFGVSLVMLPLFWGGYWLYSRSPHRWWLWGWLGLIPLLCFQMLLYPLFIAPLYHHFTPLPESPLKQKITRLAEQAGITHSTILQEDTSRRTRHVNAYVTGIGGSARIVLNDTAIQTLPEDQLLAVMGHEMGHYVEKHVWAGLISSVFGAGIFLWLASWLFPKLAKRHAKRVSGVHDLAYLPLVLLMLSLFLLLQAPLASYESRVMERRADAFGLRLTGLNDATARLHVGFAERDYSDPDPPLLLHLWFGTHPTLRERIAFALSYRR